jgi:hypothetical protein
MVKLLSPSMGVGNPLALKAKQDMLDKVSAEKTGIVSF